jgi:hypothetical protein
MAPLCRRALDLYDTLFVRDRFSRPVLERLGVSATVVESTDAAVFLASRRDPAFAPVEHRIHAGSSRRRVVVCVRDFQPAYPAAVGVRARVWRTLAAVLDRVQRDLADVFFLSTDHLARPEKQTDVEVAGGIQRMMTTPGSTVIDVEVQNPAALKHIYGQLDAMISMRLHPTILALDHGGPCLLLAYDDKCDDFFGSLDLQEFALPLAAFEYGAAMPTIERLIGSSPLVGDGPRRAELERLAGRLSLQDVVEFAGGLEPEQVRARLAGSRAFVLPSRSEGLPLTLLEAMAGGVPVVATAVGAVPEIVPAGAAVLVPSEDEAALSVAILEALVRVPNPAAIERARRRAKDYSAAAANDAYERLLDSVLDPPPGRSDHWSATTSTEGRTAFRS